MINRVVDLDFSCLNQEKYDMVFFSSGYEKRSTHIAKKIKKDNINRIAVIGFSDIENEQRKINDRYYKDHWDIEPIIVESSKDTRIYQILRENLSQIQNEINILVDYSSMSRLWYAAILNWAQYGSNALKVNIDLVYSYGKYEDNLPPMVIKDILAIPTCEGRAINFQKSIALFGLGFYGYAALCVLDRIEADIVYASIAIPASRNAYPKRVKNNNKPLLEDTRIRPLLELPLGNVEVSYRIIAELVSNYRENNEVTLVPMGPKPHVLASILVAMKFKEISCLRVSAERGDRPEKVDPTGEIAATRVTICTKNG